MGHGGLALPHRFLQIAAARGPGFDCRDERQQLEAHRVAERLEGRGELSGGFGGERSLEQWLAAHLAGGLGHGDSPCIHRRMSIH
jgi:hypothetical protein